MLKFLSKSEEVKTKWLRLPVAVFFIVLVILTAVYFIFEENYKNRIYPGVKLGEINLSGLTKSEAKEKIEKKANELSQNGVKFKYQENEITITPIISSLEADLAYQIIFFDNEKTIDKIFDFGRNENLLKNLSTKIDSLKDGKQMTAEVKIEDEEIKKILNENYKEFEQAGKDANLTATTSKNFARKIEFTVEEEIIGQEIDYDNALKKLKENLEKMDYSIIEINAKKSYPKIYKRECLNIEKEAEKITALAPFWLIYENKKWEITKEILADWLKLAKGINDKIIIDLNEEKIKKMLEEGPALQINKEAINARFEIKNDRVVEFQTNQDGIKLNIEKTISKIKNDFLAENKKEVEIIVEVDKSEISTGDINDFGIKEIIGTGHSNFVGSPKNRIHNIKAGANSLSGILIKPDEEFSLNQALGKIEAGTGYLPELVIKGNKTIPEYGGGLCQIGTTIFRTALESGLPITHRRNHSYRVSYYEPAGTDATIYSPWPDLRFINDTGNHLLIQYRIDGNDIYFDFWGTLDGRIVEKTDPIIYNIVRPGPTKIIETTDLKPGERKCTEKAHNGADAYFDYKVTYSEGEIKEKRFTSHYVPWREVCLVGIEQPTTATSTDAL